MNKRVGDILASKGVNVHTMYGSYVSFLERPIYLIKVNSSDRTELGGVTAYPLGMHGNSTLISQFKRAILRYPIKRLGLPQGNECPSRFIIA